jgi:hypothetical protein
VKRWTSWGEKGKDQLIEISIDAATDIHSISIYWGDDNNGVMIPTPEKAFGILEINIEEGK